MFRVLLLLLLAAPTAAEPSAFTLDSVPGNSFEIGGIRIYEIGGLATTARDVGAATYLAIGAVGGASLRVGDVRFHQVAGTTGSSQQIGPATYFEFEGRQTACLTVGVHTVCQ